MDIETSPAGGKSVWNNSPGRLLWTAPNTDEAVTFEECTAPETVEGVEQAARSLEARSDGQWLGILPSARL